MLRVTVALFSLLFVAASSQAQEHRSMVKDGEAVLSKSSAEGDLVTERIRQVWDGQDWMNTTRNTFNYSDSGVLELEVYDTWTDGAWAVNGQSLFSYDGLGQHVETVAQRWSGSEWTNNVKTEFVYDDMGNESERYVWRWNEGAWTPNYRTLSTHNGLGQVTVWVSQDAVTGTDEFENEIRQTRTYDEMGNLVHQLEERWDTGANDWMIFRQTTFEFDGNNNLTSTLEEEWTGDDWENNWVETRTYDETGFIIYLAFQYWENDAWVYDYREAYTNDDAGDWIELKLDVWDNGSWVNDRYETAERDERGNIVESIGQGWDGNAFVNERRTLTTYQPAVGTASEDVNPLEVPTRVSLAQNYPNPFNPSTQIDFSLAEPTTVRLAVFDALGREVAVLADGSLSAGRHSVSWRAKPGLSSGTYFYAITARGVSTTKRMVLAK